MLLPTLPTSLSFFNDFILYCDMSGRPEKIDDFVDLMKSAINLKDIDGFGAYQHNHRMGSYATLHVFEGKKNG